MKKLTVLLASLALTLMFASCQKENLKPHSHSNSTVSETQNTGNPSNNVLAPKLSIVAMSYYDGTCYPGQLNNGTQSKFIVQFNSSWANTSYGSTLYIYYRDVTASGPWVGGTTQAQVFTSPQHFFTVPNTFVNGHNYEVQFSPTPGLTAGPFTSINSWFITVTKCNNGPIGGGGNG